MHANMESDVYQQTSGQRTQCCSCRDAATKGFVNARKEAGKKPQEKVGVEAGQCGSTPACLPFRHCQQLVVEAGQPGGEADLCTCCPLIPIPSYLQYIFF